MTIPKTMRAVEITQPGGSEVLRIGTRPVPPGASDIPGLELAGSIVALGEGVKEWRFGDAVTALVQGGGYAEYCSAPAPQCLPIPKGMTPVEAASLPETFFTVWSNVFDRAGLKPGESFLVQGGSSGIGVTAIQMVKAFGNTVYATAGSQEKCDACVKLGATRAINYKTEDFSAAIKEATGKGVDVILDMVGGEYLDRELKCLADDGRIVIIAFLGGSKATLYLNDILRRRLTVTGSALRPRSVEFKGAIARNLLEKVWPKIEAGKIKAVIHKTFPLAEASKAHALMESSAHIGKIVLTI